MAISLESKTYHIRVMRDQKNQMQERMTNLPCTEYTYREDGEDDDYEHNNVGNNLLGDQGSFPFFMGAAQTNSRFTVIPGFSCSSDDPADRWIHSFDAYPFWDVFCRSAVVQAWKRDLKIESRRKVLI